MCRKGKLSYINKFISFMLILLFLCPSAISMADEGVPATGNVVGKVYVSIEDSIPQTESPDDPGPRGIMANGEVDLYDTDSMMSLVVRLAEANNLEVVGADTGYISSIGGLSEKERGSNDSGWMGTLNDWFVNKGFGEISVANGQIQSGDYIRIQYTLNLGVDLGGGFGINETNTDNSLKSLAISAGEISPAFSGNVYNYTLTIPKEVNAITLIPEASNKNYMTQVKADDTVYRYKREIPVENNTVITVICGDPGWPSMSPAPAEAKVYNIAVKKREESLKIVDPTNLIHVNSRHIHMGEKCEGTGFQLSAVDENGYPADVEWTSDDRRKRYAEIDENGYVTIKTDSKHYKNGGGSVGFTAKKKSNPSVEIKYDVVIVPMVPQLRDMEVALTEDGSPNKAIPIGMPLTYYDYYGYGAGGVLTSDDPSIIVIEDNRTPKPLRPGTTKITYTLDLGDEVITREMNVRVKGLIIRTKTELEPPVLPGNSFDLEVLTETPDEVITWTSSDSTVATVDGNGHVVAKKEGETVISATSSRINDGKPAKIIYKLMVARSKEAPYFKDFGFYNSSKFDGWEGFSPTKFVYNLTAKDNSPDVGLTYHVFTDYSKYDIYRTSYRPDGTEEKEKLPPFGQITTPLHSGENKVIFTIVDSNNENNKTDYIFNVTKDKSDEAKLKSAGVMPIDRAFHQYPLYNGYPEGTSMYMKDNVYINENRFDGDITERKVFVYNDGDKYNLSYNTTDMEAVVMTSVNGGEYKAVDNSGIIENIAIADKKAQVKIAVCSNKTYSDNVKAGMANPFIQEKVYTFDIEQVDITKDLIDSLDISDIQVSQGYFCTPGKQEIVVPGDCEQVELTIKLKNGVSLYSGDKIQEDESNKIEPDTNGIIRLSLNTNIKNHKYLSSIKFEGKSLTKDIKFNISKQVFTEGMPNGVVEYLVPGSQYTNGGTFGMYPEKSLLGNGSWNTPISLGNFGGYIVYKYDDPIRNNPNNKYGIDFIVYGNSNGSQGFSEPGNVLVSQDGNTWYTLAGSDHYENHALWDYSITYHREEYDTVLKNFNCSYKDSIGRSDKVYRAFYPIEENYPLYPWKDGEETDMTLTGLLLNVKAKDQYGTLAAAFPDWGYADTHTNSKMVNGTGENITLTREAGNPYCEDREGYGDGFDLEWAVDKSGKPVRLDSINYVKVQTASNIYAGAIGEKSTEVNAVVVPTPTGGDVGKTAPGTVKINGNNVSLGESGSFSIFDSDSDKLDINVSADSDTNVYINGKRDITRQYDSIPDKRLIRVVMQKGEKEPYICLIKINRAPKLVSGTEAETEVSMNLGEEFTLDLSKIFIDNDKDNLEYTVSIDGKEPVNAASIYKLTPDSDGKMTLIFTANDRNSSTRPTYKVNLNIKNIQSKIYGSDNNVEVELPNAMDISGVTLQVKPEEARHFALMVEGKYIAYNIQLGDSANNEISVSKLTNGGKIRVKIKLPDNLKNEKDVKLFLDDGAGNLTEYPSMIKDGVLEFETSHLSVWVVGIPKEQRSGQNSNTGGTGAVNGGANSQSTSIGSSKSKSQVSTKAKNAPGGKTGNTDTVNTAEVDVNSEELVTNDVLEDTKQDLSETDSTDTSETKPTAERTAGTHVYIIILGIILLSLGAGYAILRIKSRK